MSIDPKRGFFIDPSQNLNRAFRRYGDEIWLAAGYINRPAMLMVNIETGRQEHCVIDCLNAKHFEMMDKAAGDYWRGYMEGLRMGRLSKEDT